MAVVKRAAVALGAVLLVALAAASVVVIGFRTKYPPVLDRIRRFARDVGNPRQLASAGKAGSDASVVHHVGRRSGTPYRTPVTANRTTDGFVVGLPYGADTDWVRNILASGSTTVDHQGDSYACDRPAIIPMARAAPALPARERRILRLMGVDDCLLLHTVGPAAQP